MSLENIVGKVENAGNQHFHLFPQCFYSTKKKQYHFSNICRLPNAFKLHGPVENFVRLRQSLLERELLKTLWLSRFFLKVHDKIARGFIPLLQLNVTVMWESIQWFGENCVQTVPLKISRKALPCVLAAICMKYILC